MVGGPRLQGVSSLHELSAGVWLTLSYHAESSILTTLFALLMWPVLYHPLPGAFETPYQTAPLDLGEDTFAPAREDIFEERLEAMSKTKDALEMLRETDERERAKGTWAVGLNWEYAREDLEELVECMGGRALSGICRMLGEEYRHRSSGVPDLMWVPLTISRRLMLTIACGITRSAKRGLSRSKAREIACQRLSE